MKKGFGTLITILIVLAVAVTSFFIIWNKLTGAVVVPVSAEVAQYIGSHSVLYVQTGCSHCLDQEALFGDNYKYLTTVDCVTSPNACIVNNITATPTWVIGGKDYVGVQSIDTLKKLTNYPN